MTGRITVSENGRELVKHFESCRLKAYKCSAGVWTIGWGHTGPDVKPGMRITQEQADRLLDIDLKRFADEVNSLVKVPVTQGQFDALVSFAFNVGSDIDLDNIPEGLGDSTLLRKLNAGDYAGAADEFMKWIKSKGKVLGGLVRRRKAEQTLFRYGVLRLTA